MNNQNKSEDALYIEHFKSKINDIISAYNSELIDSSGLNKIVEANNTRIRKISELQKEFSMYIFTDISLPDCSIYYEPEDIFFMGFKFTLKYLDFVFSNTNLKISLYGANFYGDKESSEEFKSLLEYVKNDYQIRDKVRFDFITPTYIHSTGETIATCSIKIDKKGLERNSKYRMFCDNALLFKVSLSRDVSKTRFFTDSEISYKHTSGYLTTSQIDSWNTQKHLKVSVCPIGIHICKIGKLDIIRRSLLDIRDIEIPSNDTINGVKHISFSTSESLYFYLWDESTKDVKYVTIDNINTPRAFYEFQVYKNNLLTRKQIKLKNGEGVFEHSLYKVTTRKPYGFVQLYNSIGDIKPISVKEFSVNINDTIINIDCNGKIVSSGMDELKNKLVYSIPSNTTKEEESSVIEDIRKII